MKALKLTPNTHQPFYKNKYGIIAMLAILTLTLVPMPVFADLTTSIPAMEEPALQMFKVIGRTAFFLVIAIGGAAQYLGQEFSSRGKKMWLAGIAATIVIWNAPDLRDFVIGLM